MTPGPYLSRLCIKKGVNLIFLLSEVRTPAVMTASNLRCQPQPISLRTKFRSIIEVITQVFNEDKHRSEETLPSGSTMSMFNEGLTKIPPPSG